MARLQDCIESLHSMPLAEKIQAIANLIPGLTAVPPSKYGYWVRHDSYTGIGDLNYLGRLFLQAGEQCYETHAALNIRLTHASMDDKFYEIYGASYEMLLQGLKDGSIAHPVLDETVGCAYCRGEPDATILMGFHDGGALYFHEKEYRTIWGMEAGHGSRYGAMKTALMASRKQVEEALARSAGVQSLL